jgi:hypothetical protein
MIDFIKSWLSAHHSAVLATIVAVQNSGFLNKKLAILFGLAGDLISNL